MISNLNTKYCVNEDSLPPVIPNDYSLLTFNLLEMDENEIAKQLCLIDQNLFKSIKPSEFLNL